MQAYKAQSYSDRQKMMLTRPWYKKKHFDCYAMETGAERMASLMSFSFGEERIIMDRIRDLFFWRRI